MSMWFLLAALAESSDRLPCGTNWTCSPITSARWDRQPFTAPARKAEEVSALAAAMRVDVARAVSLALRNEGESGAKSGALPAAMGAAFRRQKAQREQLGSLWCRTATALRAPCRRKETHENYCARLPKAAESGPTGGFCMAEANPARCDALPLTLPLTLALTLTLTLTLILTLTLALTLHPSPSLNVNLTRPLEHYRRVPGMNSCINPWLARGLSGLFGAGSSADVGSGVGAYSMFKKLLNPSSPPMVSLDGGENIEAWSGGRVGFFDVSAAADVQGVEPVEWVMSVEMAEHVPRSLEAAVVANLHWLNTKGIVLTWALPGQPGSGHINGRSNRYVHSLLHQLGYTRDAEEEAKLRLTVNHFRLAGAADENSVLSWNANQSELNPRLHRQRAWVRRSIASLTAPAPKNAQHAGSAAAEAAQLGTMVNWLDLCPWLGDTIMVYRRPTDASTTQQLPPESPSSHGGAGAAGVKAARSEVVARARHHLCSRQRELRKLADRARSEFGKQFAVLNEHLPTNEDAKDAVVREVRLQVESHLRAFDQLARELQPEALAGCPRDEASPR